MIDDKVIKRFEDLPVWQDSQDFAVVVYELTNNFPKAELYSITNQLRRAATSISANIAEGFGRKSMKDKSQFYRIAYGPLLESKNFVYLATRLSYIDDATRSQLVQDIESLQKQINAIISYLNRHV